MTGWKRELITESFNWGLRLKNCVWKASFRRKCREFLLLHFKNYRWSFCFSVHQLLYFDSVVYNSSTNDNKVATGGPARGANVWILHWYVLESWRSERGRCVDRSSYWLVRISVLNTAATTSRLASEGNSHMLSREHINCLDPPTPLL